MPETGHYGLDTESKGYTIHMGDFTGFLGESPSVIAKSRQTGDYPLNRTAETRSSHKGNHMSKNRLNRVGNHIVQENYTTALTKKDGPYHV
jgi:hypothetical protein